MRIAFFGGTFDPPHNGHIALARAVLSESYSDRVLLVPSYAPPHKSDETISSYSDRMAMLNLAIRDEEGMEASDFERRVPLKPSYTVAVLERLRKEYSHDKLQLMIGADSLLQLHTWFQAEKLVEQYEIIACPRKGSAVTAAQLARFWPRTVAEKLANSVKNLPFFTISSTEIRKKVANGENVSSLIKEEVVNYIQVKKLYQNPNGERK